MTKCMAAEVFFKQSTALSLPHKQESIITQKPSIDNSPKEGIRLLFLYKLILTLLRSLFTLNSSTN